MIDDIFDQLKGGRIFSKFDLRSGYHEVRIKEEDINKIVLRIIYGHYEFTIVPFGLSNYPTIFMFPMNEVLREYMYKFVIILIYDIPIYSRTEEENEQHLRMVLKAFRKHKLYSKLSKCIFYQKNIHYLGHIISVIP
jgi:hypothetical protein